MTIRVLVNGALGRMGSTVVEAVSAAEDMEVCGQADLQDDLSKKLADCRPDVVVDFTVPDAMSQNLETILAAGVHVVCGTTGLPRARAEELGRLAEEKGKGLLLAPNFAVGVILMQKFAREAAAWFSDVEIIEFHHDKKQDAPSGTAVATARQIAQAAAKGLNTGRPKEKEILPGARGGTQDGIPVHSVRLPGLLAHQEVLFGSPGQILSIRHDTLDRHAFMPGVLLGIRRIREHRGLVDSLETLL